MAKVSILKGTTSYLARIFIQDSSSTTGAGLAGLVFNTSSLVCYRARDDDGNAGGTAISLVTATLGTWTSAGFKEKDATNMPGVYEFGVPNAALASGSKTVTIMLKGATNMAPCLLEIELTATDNQSATAVLTTALTESYATDGSTATAAQLLYMIWTFLSEANIASTTLTTKKIDGSTGNMTFTLSDATNPVTITRAT